MAGNKDLNRLKVVLAEKNLISGYPNNWDVRQRLFQSGVPIHHNLLWRC